MSKGLRGAFAHVGLDRVLHWLFETSLVIKLVLTSAEALTGVGLIFTPNLWVARAHYWLTHFEIADRPGDTAAVWTQAALAQFSVSDQHFYALYLIFHGGIKVLMVVMLWSRILWAYPAAMVLLAGFAGYEFYEFTLNLSPFLLMLCLFDVFMIGLIWQEYKALRTRKQFEKEAI